MHNGLFLRNVVVFHNIFTFYIIINKFHAHDFSLTEYIKYDQRIYHACVKFLLRGPCKASKNNLRGIDRFHLTSRRPYWCTKTMKWRPYWCTVRELALSYSNISYCFTTPLGPPITWVKTIYTKINRMHTIALPVSEERRSNYIGLLNSCLLTRRILRKALSPF